MEKQKRNDWKRIKDDPIKRQQYLDRRRAARQRKRDQILDEFGIDPAKKDSGICEFIECTTKLSIYNQTRFCAKHFPMLVRKGYIKEKEVV